jgi:hypothetical protein
VAGSVDVLTRWATSRAPGIGRPEVATFLLRAVRLGGADAFRATVILDRETAWDCDMEACRIVDDACRAIPGAWRQESREWVVRTRMRFPAREQDRIEWKDTDGRQRIGVVEVVDRTLASAWVKPFHGLMLERNPLRVFAEQVIGNVTKGEYAALQIGVA